MPKSSHTESVHHNSQSNFKTSLYNSVILPRSTDYLNHRRELIVNIFLASITIIAGIAFISATIHHLSVQNNTEPSSFVPNIMFIIISGSCWYASRRGKFKEAARAIVSLLCFATVSMTILYSYELPIVALLYALSVVVIGIMLTTRAALLLTFALSAFMIAIAYLQATQHLHPDLAWQKYQFQIGDAIGFVAILTLIGVITWLANREIDNSIMQSVNARNALQIERDSLEQKVLDRTRDLEQSQLVRVMQLQRFAEFGQLNAHLLHDIANPLTAAAINLEHAKANQPKSIKMARDNLKHLERYVNAARQQLNFNSAKEVFSANHELKQIKPLLASLAKSSGVRVDYSVEPKLQLLGNAVKFNQLIANLITNAIDSYADFPPEVDRIVTVIMQSQNSRLQIQVTDHGVGITPMQIHKIFEPFYTTKVNNNQGMGIGLSMVKQYVEQDFGGTIAVISNSTDGTVFDVKLSVYQSNFKL